MFIFRRAHAETVRDDNRKRDMTPHRTEASAPRTTDHPDSFFDRVVADTGLNGNGAPISTGVVDDHLGRHFKLSGELTRIPTEKDDTFKLTTDTRPYLVKVAAADEDPAIVELQSSVMRFLGQSAPELPVPRLLSTTDGAVHVEIPCGTGESPRLLRVMEFIEGSTLSEATPSHSQLEDVGAALAKLSIALHPFRHPREDRLVLWDLANFHRLGELRQYVTDSEHQRLADLVFTRYEDMVVPVLPDLETQFVHNDFSPYNTIVDDASAEYVTGILDFGDSGRSAVIFDVTVAVANQIDSRLTDPWARALSVLSGYRRVRDLPDDHVDLLAATVPARLVLRVLIAGWRAQQNPERHEYLMSHAGRDWVDLDAILSVPVSDVVAKLRSTATSGRSA